MEQYTEHFKGEQMDVEVVDECTNVEAFKRELNKDCVVSEVFSYHCKVINLSSNIQKIRARGSTKC